MFGHERFEAYQISIRFLKSALFLADTLPSGYALLKDQLKRAAISIPLNIAEGSGKSHLLDRKRSYNITRGSAMECAAICDVLELIDITYAEKVNEPKAFLKSIVSILTTVCSK